MKKLLTMIVLLMLSFQVFAATQRVLLMVIPGCSYCAQAKELLDRNGIHYQTQVAKEGPVPKLYVNGKFQGSGLETVERWVERQR